MNGMNDGITILAGDVTVGMQLAARDGYLFTVKEIVRQTPKTITLKLASDFSPMAAVRAGIVETFRKSSKFVRTRTEAELKEIGVGLTTADYVAMGMTAGQ